MHPDTILHEGELYLRLELVAETYGLEQTTLLQCYHLGLLGEGHEQDGVLCLATTSLTKVATIVRLHVHLGVTLEELPAALS